MKSELLEHFHNAGFTDIWYANPGPDNYQKVGPRWHAGVWTGSHKELICVKHCTTSHEAESMLSPAGYTPEEAVEKALAKLKGVC